MPVLLSFAIPIVLTNVIQQLYSLVDMIVIGQFVGNVGTVGVSIGGEMSDLATPVAMGFSMAGQIYIAQLFGAGRKETIKKTISTLLMLMTLISIGVMVVIIILNRQILGWLNCPQEAFSSAQSYLLITMAGLPFIFGYNAIVGILRGLGESKRPLLFICIAAAINVVLDVVFVAAFHWDAAGTALATVFSQIGSFAAAAIFIYRSREHFDLEINRNFLKIDGEISKIIFKLAIPQVARSMLVRFSMLWVNANLNAYGMIISGTNSVGNKIQKFMEVFVQGIDTACGAMIGQCLGARNFDRAKDVVWSTLKVCLIIAAACVAICWLVPAQAFRLFTTDQDVIQLGITYMHIICIHFIMTAITSTFQSMVTGCGYVELGFVLGILDGYVCRIGISLIFLNVFHADYLSYWWGTALARVLTGLLCYIYFMSGKWKTRSLLKES